MYFIIHNENSQTMKNLIDRQGYQTNYAHEEGVIFEQTNNEWSEIYTDTVAEYLYWSDAYNLFILANVGEPTLYNFEALDETFADFCTEHNIEPSDIFTDFTDDQLFAIFNILKPSFDEMKTLLCPVLTWKLKEMSTFLVLIQKWTNFGMNILIATLMNVWKFLKTSECTLMMKNGNPTQDTDAPTP